MNKQHQPVWFGLLTFLISFSSLLRTSLALSLFVTLTVAQKWNGHQQRLFILTNGNHSVRIGKNWWEFFISFQIKSKGNASNNVGKRLWTFKPMRYGYFAFSTFSLLSPSHFISLTLFHYGLSVMFQHNIKSAYSVFKHFTLYHHASRAF